MNYFVGIMIIILVCIVLLQRRVIRSYKFYSEYFAMYKSVLEHHTVTRKYYSRILEKTLAFFGYDLNNISDDNDIKQVKVSEEDRRELIADIQAIQSEITYENVKVEVAMDKFEEYKIKFTKQSRIF